MTARRLADLLLDGVRAFLDGRLLRAGRRADLTCAERIGDLLLTAGERGRFRECAVQRVQCLLPPRGGERVASLAQLLGQARERIGGLLAGAACPARIALAGGISSFLHGILGATRGRLRRFERYRPPSPLDAVCEGVGRRSEVTLGGDGGGIGALCDFLIPLRLASLQILCVFRQGCQLSFERRALEQFLAALELMPQLLLRFRESLQRLTGRFRIEARQRFL